MVSTNKWVDNEVELACKKENPDWDGHSFDYGCACYQNAGEAAKAAFKVLEKAGHSGFSWEVTVNILKRLLDKKPLTLITDDDFKLVSKNSDGSLDYENYRYHPLFKYVDKDGNVTYNDVDRFVCFEKTDPKDTWGGGLGTHIANKLFPIVMPYIPFDKPYRVACGHALHDGALGDFDLFAIYYIIEPSGKKTLVNKFYKQVFDHWYKYDDWEPKKGALASPSDWIEITKQEYEELKKAPQIETTYNGTDEVEVIHSEAKAVAFDPSMFEDAENE